MARRLNIVVSQPRASYFTGGGEIVSLEQCKRLSISHNLTLLTTARPDSDVFKLFREEAPQVKLLNFPIREEIFDTPAGHSQVRWDREALEFGLAIYDYLLRAQFDLVVTHYSVDSLVIPQRHYNILHLHGVPESRRDLDRRSISRAGSFISVSDFIAREWTAMYGLPEIVTCYNGIDEKKFRPEEIEERGTP